MRVPAHVPRIVTQALEEGAPFRVDRAGVGLVAGVQPAVVPRQRLLLGGIRRAGQDGAEGERDCLLSSPIILYDYPQVAPESPGDLFDALEIDEILTLRILTLSDREKAEIREGDDRARQVLERSESMPPEQLMKLHGALRGLRPSLSREAGVK